MVTQSVPACSSIMYVWPIHMALKSHLIITLSLYTEFSMWLFCMMTMVHDVCMAGVPLQVSSVLDTLRMETIDSLVVYRRYPVQQTTNCV